MKFISARQAIHDAYAIHMRSKGFEVNLTASISELNVAAELAQMHRRLDRLLHIENRTKHQEQQLINLKQQIEGYSPVNFYCGDRSTKMDIDQLIWDSKDAAKVIAVVEKLPAHLKAWCYWCYSPLGDTNQSWFKRIEVQAKARQWRQEADDLADMAAGLPERIARCKTENRRKELQDMDTDQLLYQATELEALADRLDRSLNQPDYCSSLWNWLDEQIAVKAPVKMRSKTLLHVRDVCRASVYNYRFQVLTGQQKLLMSRKAVCEKFGVPLDNFERNYRPWVSWCLNVCDGLDRACLIPVCNKITSTLKS